MFTERNEEDAAVTINAGSNKGTSEKQSSFAMCISVITTLVITLAVLAFTGTAYAAEATDGAASTGEQASETTPASTENLYMLTADGESVIFLKDKAHGKSAIKDLAKALVPKGAKLKSYKVTENIGYETVAAGLLQAGSSVASSKDEAVKLLKKEIKKADPKLTISVKYNKYKTKTIPIKVRFKRSKKLYNFEFVTKYKGRKGKSKTTYEYTSVNGKLESKVKKGTRTLKRMKRRVVLTGHKNNPKNLSSSNYKKYKNKVVKRIRKKYGNVELGAKIVAYGKKFLGNPYREGGKSLTNGIDCVQFVRALYRHYGIHLTENRHKLFKTGKKVSYSNARAGDVVFYGKHPAIYMGNGRIMKAGYSGIRTDNIGRNYTYIRRMR